jgi:hypothetical protein
VAAKVAADTQADLVNMDKRVKTNTPQVRAHGVFNTTPHLRAGYRRTHGARAERHSESTREYDVARIDEGLRIQQLIFIYLSF